MKYGMKVVLVALAGMILLMGCGGKETLPTTPIQDLDAPDWVIKGSGAFDDDNGKVFYGVASASGIRTTSMLRAAADNRARSEVAKVFEFYTASLMKDYMASTTSGEPGVSSEEQHVEQAIKTVTARTLSGVQIVDHWQHPSTMELYSLATLDLEEFSEALQRARELDAKVKEYIRQNADRLHEELQREEERMRER